MKTAERVLGFASCALGLLPLIGEQAKAQQAAAVCQNAATVSTLGGSTVLPLLLNSNNQRVAICGYSISAVGTSTAAAQIITGFGSACTTAGGLTTAVISLAVPPGQSIARNNLSLIFPQGTNICFQSPNSFMTTTSVEINYQLL